MSEYTALFISIIMMPYIITIICLGYELIRYRKRLRGLKFNEIVNELWTGHRYYTGVWLQTSMWFTAMLFMVGITLGLQKILLWLFN
jgi:hypothetical protein